MNEDYVLQLATLSIDLRNLYEVYDKENEIELFFGEGHNPSRIILTEPDAELMNIWLDKDWERYRLYCASQGMNDIPLRRPRFEAGEEPIDDDTHPPF